ncbi:hypothetical protein ATANTOWER_015018 [Ataeniobius toweri]|uniref:Uncharacterized protein n=1 Tax=Ataeniobius toweri TaxID=208326 RepID=A0ABU7C7P2_9TELE|nr:hypothetical protein [Ataeniobius toweri]
MSAEGSAAAPVFKQIKIDACGRISSLLVLLMLMLLLLLPWLYIHPDPVCSAAPLWRYLLQIRLSLSLSPSFSLNFAKCCSFAARSHFAVIVGFSLLIQTDYMQIGKPVH